MLLGRLSSAAWGSDDAALVASVVSTLLDPTPAYEDEKTRLFYFCELNADQHVLVTYLRTFDKTSQFLDRLKQLLMLEESKSLRLHGVCFHVFYACVMNLGPEYLKSVYDVELVGLLWTYVFNTKLFTNALDILRCCLRNKLATMQELVDIGCSTSASNFINEEDKTSVKRMSYGNFYALLRFLNYRVSAEENFAAVEFDLQILKFIQSITTYVDLDWKANIRFANFLEEFKHSSSRILSLTAHDDLKLAHLQIQKVVVLLILFLDFNFLDKKFSKNLTHADFFSFALSSLLSLIEWYSKISVDAPEDKKELVNNIKVCMNDICHLTLKLCNNTMNNSKAFYQSSSLIISSGLFEVVLLNFSQEKFENYGIICEIAVYLNYINASSLPENEINDFVKSTVPSLWLAALTFVNGFCGSYILSDNHLDLEICRNLQAVSKCISILANMNLNLAADVQSNIDDTTIKCLNILKNGSGSVRPGWFHWIVDFIHNLWNTRRFLEFISIPTLKLPETLYSACSDLLPEHSYILLLQKNFENWKSVESPRDAEILSKTAIQIENDKKMHASELELLKPKLAVKLSQYSNSVNFDSNLLLVPCDKITAKDQVFVEANLERIYANIILSPSNYYDRLGIDRSNINNFSQILLSIFQKGVHSLSGAFDPSYIKCRNGLLAIRLLTVLISHFNLEIALLGKIGQFCVECLIQKVVFLGIEPWYYSPAISLLLTLCRNDKQTKRQVVKSMMNLCFQMDRVISANSIVVMLILIDECADLLIRADDVGEEYVAAYCLQGIQMKHLPKLQMFTNRVISNVGEVHPGIIHKGVGRREVEDILYDCLASNSFKTMDELYYLLRACCTCLRDVNMRPKWLYRPYLHNWRAYRNSLADRPLLQKNMVALIAKYIVSGQGIFIVPIYAQALALSTSLMYNCTDGVISAYLQRVSASESQISRGTSLKDELLSFMLIYFARALYLLTKHFADGFESVTLTYNESISIVGTAVRNQSKNGGREGSSKSDKQNSQNKKKSDSGSAVPLDSSNVAIKRFNKAMELLAEMTVDALFSFLCLEEMFPMSAYLRNLPTFNRVPVIASVSSLMAIFPGNHAILKRGLEIFSAFAGNNLELSSLAMHASPAMIIAITTLNSEAACQQTYISILSALGNADEFAVENVLRFGAHKPIYNFLSKSNNIKIATSACVALSSICKTAEIVDIVCQELNFTSAVMDFLARWPNDKGCQVEGFRALSALSRSPDVALNIYKQPNHLSQFKKTHKFILDLVKHDRLYPEYSNAEIQELLSTSSKRGRCTIS